MTNVFGFGMQSIQLCSREDGNLSTGEGIAPTETQSIKIGDIITAIPADGEAGMQEFAHVLPHVCMKEEHFDNGPTSSNLLHLGWSETRTTEEESGSCETTTSLQDMHMINNAERSNLKQENSDLLQFLVHDVGENDIELAVNPWSEFHNQITESCSFRNTNEIQVFGECNQFNETCNYNHMQAMSPCCAAQPYNSISVAQNVDEMVELSRQGELEKIECIGTGGPAISRPETVNGWTKQDEKKQKRRERNRLCSRQFRQKQKVKEQTLTEGMRVKKIKLNQLNAKLELKYKMIFRIVSSSTACNKGRGMLNAVAGLVNKENWPGGMHVVFANTSQVQQ